MTTLLPARCPACHGEGWIPRRGLARQHRGGILAAASAIARCHRCGGSGELSERRYLTVRRCSRCARPFQPSADAVRAGRPVTTCTWCSRREGRERPAGSCRACGRPLEARATGRPPSRCVACSPSRRAYAARRSARPGRRAASDVGTVPGPAGSIDRRTRHGPRERASGSTKRQGPELRQERGADGARQAPGGRHAPGARRPVRETVDELDRRAATPHPGSATAA